MTARRLLLVALLLALGLDGASALTAGTLVPDEGPVDPVGPAVDARELLPWSGPLPVAPVGKTLVAPSALPSS